MIFCSLSILEFECLVGKEKAIFGKVVDIMPRDRKWPSAATVGVPLLASDQLHCVHKPPPPLLYYIGIRVNKQKKTFSKIGFGI